MTAICTGEIKMKNEVNKNNERLLFTGGESGGAAGRGGVEKVAAVELGRSRGVRGRPVGVDEAVVKSGRRTGSVADAGCGGPRREAAQSAARVRRDCASAVVIVVVVLRRVDNAFVVVAGAAAQSVVVLVVLPVVVVVAMVMVKLMVMMMTMVIVRRLRLVLDAIRRHRRVLRSRRRLLQTSTNKRTSLLISRQIYNKIIKRQLEWHSVERISPPI